MSTHIDGQENIADNTLSEHSADKHTEHTVVLFLQEVIEKMGHTAELKVESRPHCLYVYIESESQSILIGRNGRNIDALQLLANIVARRVSEDRIKVILDSGDYRLQHEKMLVKLAHKVSAQVLRTGRSQLLEPMNSFERGVVHRALRDVDQIATYSEGEGVYKQVRIFYSEEYDSYQG